MFFKLGVFINFGNSTEKHLCWSLQHKKETPTQVFPCDISEIFKNTVFYRTHMVAASEKSY